MNKKKLYYFLTIFIFLPVLSYSQFDLQAGVSDTDICLGECVNLWSSYNNTNQLMGNDFNNGTVGTGWQSNASPMFNNPCGPGPDGTIYAWIGPATNFPRELVTQPYTVTTACTICFDMKYAVQANSSPCEGPDEPTEGVHLQYSTDGGNTWIDINYWDPNGGYDSYLTTWHNYCENVPINGSNVQFRWFQNVTSGNDYDHWGIDNVYITCPNDPPNIVWNDGNQDFWYDTVPPTQCPTQSTDYTVTVYNDSQSESQTVHVTVYMPPTADAGQNDEVCGYQYTLSANTPNVGVGTWSSTETGVSFSDINNPNATVTVTSPGYHTFLWTVNNGVCSASDSVTILFDEPPVANAGINDNICGSHYTLNATPSVGIGTWTSNPPYNIHIYDQHNPNSELDVFTYGDFTFTWTEVNGLCSDADSITVHFKLIPTSDFSVDSLWCYQDVINITYNGNADDTANFHWYFDNATIINGANEGPYSIYWPNQGNYNISLWVEQEGCYSDTTTYSFFNPPELQASLSHTNVTCYGYNNATITPTVTGGVPPYHFNWNTGNTDTALIDIGAGNYNVTINDSHGCEVELATIITEPESLSIAMPASLDVCNGQPVTINPTVTGGTQPYNYQWNNGQTNINLNFIPTNDTIVSMLVTDNNGCQDSASTYIDVSEPLHMNLVTSRDSVCKGDNITVNAAFWGGSGGPYYIYDNEQNVLTLPLIVTIQNDTTFVIHSRDVCGSIASDTANVYIYPMPNVQFISDTTSGCQPLPVNFTVVQGAEHLTSYIWNFGDNDNQNLSVGINPYHLYNDYGTFTVTLMYKTDKGCKDTARIENMINVYKKPHAEFITKPSAATIINPTMDFINTSLDNIINIWSFGDGDSSIQVNPRHIYAQIPKTYLTRLIVESNKGCKDTATKYVEIQDVNVFYAPTAFTPDNDGINEIFYVVIRNIDNKQPFYLSMFDRWGELIWQTDKYDPENPAHYGWNGIIKGDKPAPPDTYVWHCMYYDKDGNQYQKSGNIVLIR